MQAARHAEQQVRVVGGDLEPLGKDRLRLAIVVLRKQQPAERGARRQIIAIGGNCRVVEPHRFLEPLRVGHTDEHDAAAKRVAEVVVARGLVQRDHRQS